MKGEKGLSRRTPTAKTTASVLQALPEDSVVGPRASVFSSGKDGEAGDIGFIVDAAGCSQAENKPLEARSSLLTQPKRNFSGDVKQRREPCPENVRSIGPLQVPNVQSAGPGPALDFQ